MSNRQERRRAERQSKKTPKQMQMEMRLLQPWSVPVLQMKLPAEVLDTMIAISDDVIADKESINHGEYLAGQIDTELRVSHERLVDGGIMQFFEDVVKQFLLHTKMQQFPFNINVVQAEKYFVQMLTMWVVSQQPNEYNPIHVHTECQISSVMYLKVPKFAPTKKIHRDLDDGSITFISNTSADTEFSQPTVTLRPEVGDFFVFGAKQLHTVYPYRCEEGDTERRSVSFNAIYETGTTRKRRLEGDNTLPQKRNSGRIG